jgi:hypothetical protein
MVKWAMKSDDAAVTLFVSDFGAPQRPLEKKKRHFLPFFEEKVYMCYERGYDEYIYIMKQGPIIGSFRDWRMYIKK